MSGKYFMSLKFDSGLLCVAHHCHPGHQMWLTMEQTSGMSPSLRMTLTSALRTQSCKHMIGLEFGALSSIVGVMWAKLECRPMSCCPYIIVASSTSGLCYPNQHYLEANMFAGYRMLGTSMLSDKGHIC